MPSQQPMKLASRQESRRTEKTSARSAVSKYFAVGSLAVVALSIALGLTSTPGELFQGKLVTVNPDEGRTVTQPRLSTGLTYAPGETVTAEFKNISDKTVLIPVSCSVTRWAGENVYISVVPTAAQCTITPSGDKVSVTWDQLDLSGIQVQDGRYRLEAQLYVNGALTTITSGRFRIRTVPVPAPDGSTSSTTTTTLPPGTTLGTDPFGNPIIVHPTGQTP